MARVLVGEGELFEGDTSRGRVRYRITYRHDMLRASTMGQDSVVQGSANISGTLQQIDGRPDFFDLHQRDAKLTLRFDAGEWECVVTAIPNLLSGAECHAANHGTLTLRA